MNTYIQTPDGLNTETPLEVLERRDRDDFIPGNDDDGCVLYLVGDGGGMATSAVAGGLNVLATRGLMSRFNGFGAISGGGGAMACAVIGATAEAEDIYTRLICNVGFFSKKRFLEGGPLVDLRVIGEIIRSTGIKASDLPIDQPFLIGLSEISDTGINPTVEVAQKTGEDFTDTLLDSMHMPWFCGPPRSNRIDGGIGWLSTALMTAQEGASKERPVTHVLGMASTPNPECIPNDRIGGFTRAYISKHFGPLVSRSLEAFPFVQARHLNEEINTGTMQIDGRIVAVQMLRPVTISNFAGVLTTDHERLKATYDAGQQGVTNALNGLPHEFNKRSRLPLEDRAGRIIEMLALGGIPRIIKLRQLLPTWSM